MLLALDEQHAKQRHDSEVAGRERERLAKAALGLGKLAAVDVPASRIDELVGTLRRGFSCFRFTRSIGRRVRAGAAGEAREAFARARQRERRGLVAADILHRPGLEPIDRVVHRRDARGGPARARAAVELGGHLLPVVEVEAQRRVELRIGVRRRVVGPRRLVEARRAVAAVGLAGLERRDEPAAHGEVAVAASLASSSPLKSASMTCFSTVASAARSAISAFSRSALP